MIPIISTMPHPTLDDLRTATARFDAEAVPGSFHTPRYRMRYRIWGDGPTIVIVHGLCDSPRSFCMLMANLVDAGFRCVCYDLANGKDDDAAFGRYKHADYVADLVALIDHLKLDRVDILGSSFGSTITLAALAKSPDRFRKAVLQGGFARRGLMRIERGLSRLGRYWPWRMGQLPIRERVMERLEKHQFVGCPDEIFEFLIECSGETPIRAAARRALIIDTLDLRPKLASIPHPVLMIGGDRDALVPRNVEAQVEAGLRNVRRVEFSPCGHYPQYTMPKPMADEIARFLRQE
jgi:pimeloyl-ACP methyl ester carboxylesterase